MSEDGVPFDDKNFDEFWLNGLFPQAKEIFNVCQRPIAEIKADCIVALDANVLLLPYELGSSSFSKIAEIYKLLAEEKRLLIPAQAAREFAKNRSTKLRDLVKYINDQASLLSFSLHEQISFLGDEEAFKNIKKQSAEIEKSRKKILSEIRSIKQKISGNVGSDPVSSIYSEIFKDAVFELNLAGEELDKFKRDALWRYTHRVPPGYKDRSKVDGGLGDLIIWKSLLAAGAEQGKNLIFVTKDVKGDWWVQSQGAFQPRFELIEEYHRVTGGKTIHLISLSQLLETFEVEKEAVSDVRRAEDSAAQFVIKNYLGRLSEAMPAIRADDPSFAGYSLAHLLAERRDYERQISEIYAAARPIKAGLESSDSMPEAELKHLIQQDRIYRNQRTLLRHRIAQINRELSRRSASEGTEPPQ